MIAGTPVSFKETMDIIDEHYNYFEVPFTNGDLESKPNENIGSAKIFSFGLLPLTPSKLDDAKRVKILRKSLLFNFN